MGWDINNNKKACSTPSLPVVGGDGMWVYPARYSTTRQGICPGSTIDLVIYHQALPYFILLCSESETSIQ
ncbi:hypothetical protein NXS19_005426 [Fusarium pseudograminearum]|nr:hypothetical protein NXS19_005426 [Fusarium pseudograminearum]